MNRKEIFTVIAPVILGLIIASFQFGKSAQAQSNNQRSALTGPIKVNGSGGKAMLAVFSSATKGTVLRFYDKDGNAIADLSGTDNPTSLLKGLSVSAPSSDGP